MKLLLTGKPTAPNGKTLASSKLIGTLQEPYADGTNRYPDDWEWTYTAGDTDWKAPDGTTAYIPGVNTELSGDVKSPVMKFVETQTYDDGTTQPFEFSQAVSAIGESWDYRTPPANSSFANSVLSVLHLPNIPVGSLLTKISGGITGTLTPVLTSLWAALTDKGGQVHNIRAYGALSDGATNDAAALQAAVTAATVKGGAVLIPPGVSVINTSITLPANVSLRFENGGVLKLGAGVTLNLRGPVDSAPVKCFDQSAGGVVSFASNKVQGTVWSEWWGTKGDAPVTGSAASATDDATTLNQALTAAATAPLGMIVRLCRASYAVGAKLTIGHNTTLIGEGMGISLLRQKDNASLATFFESVNGATNLVLRNFTVDGNQSFNTGQSQGYQIRLVNPVRPVVDSIEVKDFYGFWNKVGNMFAVSGLSTDGVFNNLHVHDGGYYLQGVEQRNCDGIFVGGSNNRITNCVVKNVTDTAIVQEKCSNPTVIGNVIVNCRQGIAVSAGAGTNVTAGGVVDGNTISGIYARNGQAIYITRVSGTWNRNISVTGNTIRDCPHGAGIYVKESAYINLTGNNIHNINGNAGERRDGKGILVENSIHVAINGSVVDTTAGEGIALVGVKNFTLSNNLVSNTATFAPGASAGMYVGKGPELPATTEIQIYSFIGGPTSGNMTLTFPAIAANPGEVQTYSLLGGPPSGDVVLDFPAWGIHSAASTVEFARNALASEVQTALEGLPHFAPGDVTVVRTGAGTSSNPYVYTATFLQSLENVPLPTATHTFPDPPPAPAIPYSVSIGLLIQGHPAIPEQTTTSIPYNATSTQFRTALEALSRFAPETAGNSLVTVNRTGTGTIHDPYVYTTIYHLALGNVPTPVATHDFTDAIALVQVAREGAHTPYTVESEHGVINGNVCWGNSGRGLSIVDASNNVFIDGNNLVGNTNNNGLYIAPTTTNVQRGWNVVDSTTMASEMGISAGKFIRVTNSDTSTMLFHIADSGTISIKNGAIFQFGADGAAPSIRSATSEMRIQPGSGGTLGTRFTNAANNATNLHISDAGIFSVRDGATITHFGTTTGMKIGATGAKVGFYGATPVVRPTVSGSRDGNEALASLLTALATQGIITDTTTA